MLFRGFLLPYLARHMSLAGAVLLCAAVFSALHPLNTCCSLFFVSVLFGTLYASTRNLAAPVVAHCLWNALQFIALALQCHWGPRLMV